MSGKAAAAQASKVVPLVRRFFARQYGITVVVLAGGQAIVALGTLLLYYILIARSSLSGQESLSVILFTVCLIEVIVLVASVRFILSPLKTISEALLRAVDPTITGPSVPRAFSAQSRADLEQMMKLIRELAIAPGTTTKKYDPLSKRILDSLPIGFIALDEKRRIIAYNGLAPIAKNARGEASLQLLFHNQEMTLTQWLGGMAADKIDDSHIWTQIANRPRGDDERRIFDVLAHYEKYGESGITTLIVCLDKTDVYSDDEATMDFVSLAAHELRGPITAIRGYLEMLDDNLGEEISPHNHDILQRLEVSASRLSTYVNNILNASHFDHQHLQLRLQETSIEELLFDAKEQMDMYEKAFGRKLNYQIPHGLPTVAADRGSISEVLVNLIDNAIKYSPRDGVIEVYAERADDNFVAISVRDHGIGIPPNLMEHLFQKFYRSHRSSTAIGGSGLGLYISRAIVESHGGRISARSREGQGTTFTFTLPVFSTVADQIAAGNQNLIAKKAVEILNHGDIVK